MNRIGREKVTCGNAETHAMRFLREA